MPAASSVTSVTAQHAATADRGRPGQPAQPAGYPHAGCPALGRECFPVLVSRANVQPVPASAARPSAPPRPQQAPAARR